MACLFGGLTTQGANARLGMARQKLGRAWGAVIPQIVHPGLQLVGILDLSVVKM